MADVSDYLGMLGRAVGNVVSVPLTGLGMVMAARQGRDPRSALPGYMSPSQQAELQLAQDRQWQARQLFASTPEGQAALTQNPDIAKSWGIPVQETTTPTAGLPVTEGTGPLASVTERRPQFAIDPSQTLKGVALEQAKARNQTQQALAQIFQGLLGGAGQTQMPPLPGGGVTGNIAGAAGGPGIVNMGGTNMRAVPSISASGGLGLNFQPVQPYKAKQGDINPDTGKAFQPGDTVNGRPVVLSSNITPATRTMSEQAQKIPGMIARARASASALGDVGRLGTMGRQLSTTALPTSMQPDQPEWQRHEADMGVLTTAVMRMHVGARGGEYVMHHFQKMLDPYLPPASKEAALQELEKYAADVAKLGTDGAASKWFPETQNMPAWSPDKNDLSKMGMSADEAEKVIKSTPPTEGAAPGGKSGLEGLRDKVRNLGNPNRVVARAKGGPVKARQIALVGEQGPELLQANQPTQVLRLAENTRPPQPGEPGYWPYGANQAPVPAGGSVPGVGASAPTPSLGPAGLSQGGQGLRPEDIPAAQGGATITLDQYGNPVIVPR